MTTTTRAERAAAIPQCDIRRTGGGFEVRSQTGPDRNWYSIDGSAIRCGCPDQQIRGCRCKHLLALDLWLDAQATDAIAEVEARAADRRRQVGADIDLLWG